MDEVREWKQIEPGLEESAADLNEIYLQLSWVSRRHLEHELSSFHLTVPQYIALHCIYESEKGCSMTELAELAHQVSATMTGIVDRLAERGLVVRERDAHDRRAMHVVLTPAGQELMERISEHKQEQLSGFMSTLSVEQRQQMIDLARRYLDFVGQGIAQCG